MSTEMLQASGRREVQDIVDGWRRQGGRIAFVPTMGNLHAGHLSLVRAARDAADHVVTSIYVNPTQFGEGEDYDSYPRTLEADRQALEAGGCDVLFTPGHATVYPLGIGQGVRVGAPVELASRLEGRSRPGHFDGVLTVVLRLFNLVMPDLALFGEKDYQQLLLIRRMVEDLSLPLRVIAVPTMRESDGLAMSSRNAYLDPEQRNASAALNAVLHEVAVQVDRDPTSWPEAEQAGCDKLERLGFDVDYVAVRRAIDLDKPSGADSELRVLVAARLGRTRLIDNLKIA